MSGVVAVINVDRRRPAPDEELAALVRSYEAVRGPQRSVGVGDGHARAVWLGTHDDEHGTVTNGQSWVARVGQVYDLEGRPRRDAPLRPAELDGQFALVSHDAETGDTVVATDAFGMVALYVAQRDGRLLVSTSSLALARHVGAVADRLRLQQFVLSGYHFGAGTHWQGIERLEPATAVRLTATGRRDEVYWRPRVDESVRRMSLAQAADHCIEVAVDAVRSRLREGPRTWSDLTGGYDSRLLNLLVDRAGVAVETNTREDRDARELPTAAGIARLQGWPWTAYRVPEDWPEQLPGRLAAALGWGDGNLEVLQLSRELSVHEQLSRTGRRLLSGGGGEHLQYTPWRSEFARAGRSNRVDYDNWIDMRMLKPVDGSVLAGDPLPAVRADFRARMSAWAAPYADELNTTQLDYLHAYKMTGHYGAYRSASDGLLGTELPYYFRPLFEAAFSVHHKHRNLHRLMRHMTTRLSPAVAAVATTRGGPALPVTPGNAHRFVPYYVDLARKAVTKTTGRAIGRPLLLQRRPYAWEPRAHCAVLTALRADGVLPISRMATADLYDGPVLEDVLARASQPGFSEHALLGRVLTVELAVRAVGSGTVT